MHARAMTAVLVACWLTMTQHRAVRTEDPSWTPALRLVERRTLVEPRDSTVRRATGASFCGTSALVVAYERPNAIAVFDTAGHQRWYSERRARVESVRCTDSVIALLEHEDDWIFRLLAVGTRRELMSTTVESSSGDHVDLLGWTGRTWALEVHTRYSVGAPAEALRFPRRTAVLLDMSADSFVRGFVRLDSSPQVVPSATNGGTRLPVRPPFAPVFSIAVDTTGRFFASGGDTHAVEVRDFSGIRTGLVTIPDPAPPRTSEERDLLVESWHRMFRAVWPDSLRDRAMALDDGGRNAILGRIIASPSGALLIQRRDLEANPLSRDAERMFDVVDSSGHVRGRLRVPLGTTIEGYSGDHVVVLRRSASGPVPQTRVVIMAIREPE